MPKIHYDWCKFFRSNETKRWMRKSTGLIVWNSDSTHSKTSGYTIEMLSWSLEYLKTTREGVAQKFKQEAQGKMSQKGFGLINYSATMTGSCRLKLWVSIYLPCQELAWVSHFVSKLKIQTINLLSIRVFPKCYPWIQWQKYLSLQ